MISKKFVQVAVIFRHAVDQDDSVEHEEGCRIVLEVSGVCRVLQH